MRIEVRGSESMDTGVNTEDGQPGRGDSFSSYYMGIMMEEQQDSSASAFLSPASPIKCVNDSQGVAITHERSGDIPLLIHGSENQSYRHGCSSVRAPSASDLNDSFNDMMPDESLDEEDTHSCSEDTNSDSIEMESTRSTALPSYRDFSTEILLDGERSSAVHCDESVDIPLDIRLEQESEEAHQIPCLYDGKSKTYKAVVGSDSSGANVIIDMYDFVNNVLQCKADDPDLELIKLYASIDMVGGGSEDDIVSQQSSPSSICSFQNGREFECLPLSIYPGPNNYQVKVNVINDTEDRGPLPELTQNATTVLQVSLRIYRMPGKFCDIDWRGKVSPTNGVSIQSQRRRDSGSPVSEYRESNTSTPYLQTPSGSEASLNCVTDSAYDISFDNEESARGSQKSTTGMCLDTGNEGQSFSRRKKSIGLHAFTPFGFDMFGMKINEFESFAPQKEKIVGLSAERDIGNDDAIEDDEDDDDILSTGDVLGFAKTLRASLPSNVEHDNYELPEQIAHMKEAFPVGEKASRIQNLQGVRNMRLAEVERKVSLLLSKQEAEHSALKTFVVSQLTVIQDKLLEDQENNYNTASERLMDMHEILTHTLRKVRRQLDDAQDQRIADAKAQDRKIRKRFDAIEVHVLY